MASSSNPPKEKAFSWDLEATKMFVELLLAYERKYGWDQPYNWGELKPQFEALCKRKCNIETLKTRNRKMKAHWNEWKDFKRGETGLGWDPVTGTVTATKEWWDRKLADNANYKKFQKKGVPRELEELWEQLYGGDVATGQYCIAPSMTVSQRPSQPPPPASYTVADDDDDDGDGDSDADAQRGDVDTPAAYHDLFSKHVFMFKETNDRLLAMLEKEEVFEKPRPYTNEVMDVVNDMVAEGLLEEAGTMWCFCVDTLVDRGLASMFLSINHNNARLAWMAYLYNEKKGST